MLLTPGEFEEADANRRFRYELIRGILVVIPTPPACVRDANEHLTLATGFGTTASTIRKDRLWT
jgi:hypothetical protein